MRYRFYREHKYICSLLNNFESSIAKADFTDPIETAQLAQALDNLADLLKSHAEHEETAIHALLKEKEITYHLSIEAQHTSHEKDFTALKEMLRQNSHLSAEKQISLGQEFYLSYRFFKSELLEHFHEEETTIMASLLAYYSDAELRQVEAKTYAQMTAHDMTEMVTVLFPHFNSHDKLFFLKEILQAEPDKFKQAWPNMQKLLNEHEVASFTICFEAAFLR